MALKSDWAGELAKTCPVSQLKWLRVLISTTAALTAWNIWHLISAHLRLFIAGEDSLRAMSLLVQGKVWTAEQQQHLHSNWIPVVLLNFMRLHAGAASTLWWLTEMQYMCSGEIMGKGYKTSADIFQIYVLLYVCENSVSPNSKNMLNDLLRFDVKDCSWCR